MRLLTVGRVFMEIFTFVCIVGAITILFILARPFLYMFCKFMAEL